MRRLALLGVAALALVAAGCGGSSPTTKEQFESAFKATCDEFSKRAEGIHQVDGDPTSESASPLMVARFGHVVERVTTLFGQQLDALRSIEPPASEAARYHRFLRLYAETEAVLGRAARAARKGDRVGMVSQLSALDELGAQIDETGFQCG